MSRYTRRIGRAAAERLLRGEPADPRHPDDLLAALLATAAAPARVGELAGEEAAVAAFRRARAAGAFRTVDRYDDVHVAPERPWNPARARRWMRHPMRVALVALTATTAGGVALAASSSGWSHDPADHSSATPSATSSGRAGGVGAGRVQGGSPAAMPHPAAVGLCRAYRAGAGDAPGKALDNHAFASLIRAAGGRDKVAGYCDAVLTAEAKRSKTAKKTRPSGQPTPPSHSAQPESGQPQSGQSQAGRPGLPTPFGRDARPSVSPPSPAVTPAPASASPTDLPHGTASPQPLGPHHTEAAVTRT